MITTRHSNARLLRHLDQARLRHAQHRAQAATRRELAREIAAYSSEADLLELESILARHPDDETRELRGLVGRQRMAVLG